MLTCRRLMVVSNRPHIDKESLYLLRVTYGEEKTRITCFVEVVGSPHGDLKEARCSPRKSVLRSANRHAKRSPSLDRFGTDLPHSVSNMGKGSIGNRSIIMRSEKRCVALS